MIVPGNVYVYGDQPGLWTEDTPHRPTTRKGRIRQQMEAAMRASGVQTIILRAGDFIAAGPGDSDIMGRLLLARLRRGKVTAPGDPDALHAFGYLPDWAQAAQMLAARRGDLGRFTALNLGGANFTLRQLCTTLSQAQARPLVLARFPWAGLRLAAPLWELARELLEMRYLWDLPHGLAQERLCGLLPDYRPTDLRQIMLAAAPPPM